MTEELAHSPLGPSSAERWLNCPGSVAATAGMPDVDTEYSKEGTLAHEIAYLARLEDVPAATFLGPRSKMLDAIPDQAMVDHVQGFIDYVNALPGEQMNEQRVRYEAFVQDGFGTLDAAVLRDGEADVIDLKYGQGVQVDATDNSQLKLYALGIYLEHDWVYAFKQFHLHVYQPRLDHIDRWTIGVDDLLRWAKEVVAPGALLAMRKGAPFKAGKWCQFCKIRETCRTRAETVFKAAVGDFEDLDAAVTMPMRAGLSNDEIAKVLIQAPTIKQWLKDIEAYAAKEVMQGRPVGDFKFVAGRGSRAWGLQETELVLLAQKTGVPTKDLYGEPKLLSPPQAEKVLGKKHPFLLMRDVVVKNAGKPALVPGSDPRPAVVVDATVEFPDLDE